MLFTVSTDLELRLLMSMPWPLIILKNTTESQNQDSISLPCTRFEGRYNCLLSFSGRSEGTALHHTLQHVYLPLVLCRLPRRTLRSAKREEEWPRDEPARCHLTPCLLLCCSCRGITMHPVAAWDICCYIYTCFLFTSVVMYRTSSSKYELTNFFPNSCCNPLDMFPLPILPQQGH